MDNKTMLNIFVGLAIVVVLAMGLQTVKISTNSITGAQVAPPGPTQITAPQTLGGPTFDGTPDSIIDFDTSNYDPCQVSTMIEIQGAGNYFGMDGCPINNPSPIISFDLDGDGIPELIYSNALTLAWQLAFNNPLGPNIPICGGDAPNPYGGEIVTFDGYTVTAACDAGSVEFLVHPESAAGAGEPGAEWGWSTDNEIFDEPNDYIVNFPSSTICNVDTSNPGKQKCELEGTIVGTSFIGKVKEKVKETTISETELDTILDNYDSLVLINPGSKVELKAKTISGSKIKASDIAAFQALTTPGTSFESYEFKFKDVEISDMYLMAESKVIPFFSAEETKIKFTSDNDETRLEFEQEEIVASTVGQCAQQALNIAGLGATKLEIEIKDSNDDETEVDENDIIIILNDLFTNPTPAVSCGGELKGWAGRAGVGGSSR